MRLSRFIGKAGILVGLAAFLSMPAFALAQDLKKRAEPATPDAPASTKAVEALKAIEAEYQDELLRLDRRRLERLAQLAAQQNPADAAVTYEQLFRLAIAGNLFRDAEPAAKTLLERGSPSRTSTALAHLVKIVAEADRGAFDQSFESLQHAIAQREKAVRERAPGEGLDPGEILSICEAYYQRLIHEGQYETARKAIQAILAKTERPVLKEFLSSRLKRLEKVGKPAPPIQGTDIDGKPFDLAAAKGKVVLIVFWASWCLPGLPNSTCSSRRRKCTGGRGFRLWVSTSTRCPRAVQSSNPRCRTSATFCWNLT